ncbi:hypothetical protein FY004_27370 [Streptomyces parvus]|uniref:Uncharacterized protein n=1 Tax=Streptomyces parvus TaxID=66428 RepID=A0A5D4ILF8_9ACTN|nr:hypothetical protein FY004_27370 [Streptomyces parvus]
MTPRRALRAGGPGSLARRRCQRSGRDRGCCGAASGAACPRGSAAGPRAPSGRRYWTVVDENFVTVPEPDAFLRHVRFGRDQAE